MRIILEDIKIALGVSVDNLGFDSELLMFVNSAKANLVQLGVDEFDIDIDEATTWPSLATEAMTSYAMMYILLKTKQGFDPTPSETIAKTIASALVDVEGRLAYEVQEVENP